MTSPKFTLLRQSTFMQLTGCFQIFVRCIRRRPAQPDYYARSLSWIACALIARGTEPGSTFLFQVIGGTQRLAGSERLSRPFEQLCNPEALVTAYSCRSLCTLGREWEAAHPPAGTIVRYQSKTPDTCSWNRGRTQACDF